MDPRLQKTGSRYMSMGCLAVLGVLLVPPGAETKDNTAPRAESALRSPHPSTLPPGHAPAPNPQLIQDF